jgi:hypothetical protein
MTPLLSGAKTHHPFVCLPDTIICGTFIRTHHLVKNRKFCNFFFFFKTSHTMVTPAKSAKLLVFGQVVCSENVSHNYNGT